MSDGNDFDVRLANSINNVERIPQHNESSAAEARERVTFRRLCNAIRCVWRTNSAAAAALRSTYHFVAMSRSSSAAGWNVTLFIQAGVKLCPNLFPRNRFDFTRIELPDAPLDLLGPGSLDVLVGFAVQAFEESARKLGPIRFRQFARLSKQLCDLTRHGSILPRSHLRVFA